MEDHTTLPPARPERLRWLEPPAPLHERSGDLQARLEKIVAGGATTWVYAAHRRNVYRAEDPELGSIAIKELRNPSLARQLWYGWFAEHRALGEYRNAVEFESRGGATPGTLAAALERSAIGGLERVLLFTRWLDNAVTLTRWLAERPGPPQPRVLATLATQLAAAARLGFVHGRHSSENLLVVTRGGEPVLYSIDFAHANLGRELDPAGLARDVARIAYWLLRKKVWPRATIQAFFEAVALELRAETAPGVDLASQMSRELEEVTRTLASRRPKPQLAE